MTLHLLFLLVNLYGIWCAYNSHFEIAQREFSCCIPRIDVCNYENYREYSCAHKCYNWDKCYCPVITVVWQYTRRVKVIPVMTQNGKISKKRFVMTFFRAACVPDVECVVSSVNMKIPTHTLSILSFNTCSISVSSSFFFLFNRMLW